MVLIEFINFDWTSTLRANPAHSRFKATAYY
jgi:hypothetical protein